MFCIIIFCGEKRERETIPSFIRQGKFAFGLFFFFFSLKFSFVRLDIFTIGINKIIKITKYIAEKTESTKVIDYYF